MLAAVIRRCRSGSLLYRLLDRLERVIYVRRSGGRRFEEGSARLVRLSGKLVYSTPIVDPSVDVQRQRNLDLIVGTCEGLGSEYFVVAAGRRGPLRVGAPVSERSRVVASLLEQGESDPFYVALRTPSAAARGLACDIDPELARAATRIGLWHYLDDPEMKRSLGASLACWIEFWDELPDGRLVAPSPNARAAEVMAEARERRTTIEFRDQRYVTIPPFTAPSPFEVAFPVDMVYLWVDGQDPAWQARRGERLGRLLAAPPSGSTAEERFREQDELRYSLRSIERFAPWVRHIYLVTDQQRPHWLVDSHPRLTMVDHREIFPSEVLPTFNSHAISARAHHIDGLSEHFLLMNDDVLLGRPVGPESFFHANGLLKFFLSNSPIPSGPVAADDPPHVAARKRVRDLIEHEYGFTPRQTFKHTPVPMRRSRLFALEERFPEELKRTVSNPFRAADDLVPSWLHHYSGYAEGASVPSTLRYDYFNLAWSHSFRRMQRLLARPRLDCFCINDLEAGDLEFAERVRLLAAFLAALLPSASSFEREGLETMRRSDAITILRAGLDA